MNQGLVVGCYIALRTDNSIATDEHHAIMGGLLDACKKNLQTQGMRKMFFDGVSEGLEPLTQLGQSKLP